MRLERFLGCHSGVSNNRIIEARESLLAEMVEKGLSQHPDQSSMAIKAWKNRDKLSTAFLLELPGPHNQWSSAEWGEALCLVLSLPPNCCRDPQKLGQPIGNRHVDLWGAEVMCATLPGGSWTCRHDRVKCAISSLAVYCGVIIVCEPYAVFSAHLPQRPLHHLQGHQARQALRPDFLLHLRSATGDMEQLIADVKTVSFGNKTFYKPGMQGNKAVQLRATRIGGEYQRTALKVDQELGFADGGPTLRNLQGFPPVLDLVFGAYGECSDGVKSMLDSFGDSRLRTLGLAKGTPQALKELGQVTGYLRRRLSSAVIRANVRCLLERMLMVGEGVGQAGRRRQWARQEEEKARWEREGQWLVRLTGRNLARRGDFPSP